LSISYVQVCQIVRDTEEHVHLLIEVLEACSIVGKVVRRVGRRGVTKEDTLDLTRVIRGQLRVGFHDVRVTGICHQDEFAVGKCLEDLVEQELSDRKRRGDIAEIERAGVETATGIGLVDEVHVVACDLPG